MWLNEPNIKEWIISSLSDCIESGPCTCIIAGLEEVCSHVAAALLFCSEYNKCKKYDTSVIDMPP